MNLTKKKKNIILWSCVALLAAGWLAFVISGTIYRYMTFATSTYDFGIFSQMFYNMSIGNGPVTTCERDVLMSHFLVHMSPIYYLVLPVYMLFQSQQIVLIIQAVAVISGIVPLCLICKEKKLGYVATLLFAVIYAFYPALIGGSFYDFHENCFLPVLLLWLLYFVEKRQGIPAMIFMLLALLVKEDSAVYVACIGLYAIFEKKYYRMGLAIFVISLVYFFSVVDYISTYGDELFSNRMDNVMPDPDAGLVSIVFLAVKNPAYFIGQFFTGDKVVFLLQVMMPIIFLPFVTKRIWRYFLMIPFILFNMAPDYVYMHNIMFQYVFGSGPLLLFMAVINFADIKLWMEEHLKGQGVYICRGVLALSAVIAVCLTCVSMASKTRYMNYYYSDRHDSYNAVAQLLAQIPQEDSVAASSYYVPQLSMREEVYREPLGEKLTSHDVDWVVLDRRGTNEGEKAEVLEQIALYEEKGYEVVNEIQDWVTILKKK